MSVLFVTGSGTDIGKTYVTALLVRQLIAAGRGVVALKPLVSGVGDWRDPSFASSDTAILLEAQDLSLTAQTVDACSPWRFTAPLSPDMAAAREGRTLALSEVVDWTRTAIARAPAEAIVVIEGVGGAMSPISGDATGLDWLQALGCPALLVTGSYLGAVSHALTTHAAIRARGLVVAGVVVNETPGSTVGLDDTVMALQRFLPDQQVQPLQRGTAAPLHIVHALMAQRRR
ncbi:MAG: dethiobiotin synthase [Caulobacteraceae bacterium]